MSTHVFPQNALDGDGGSLWVSELAAEAQNQALHVVRHLPPPALILLGACPKDIRVCELPAEKPSARTSLPRAAIGPTESNAVLLSGRIGEWTFVYDDAGFSTWEGTAAETLAAKQLSTEGGVAATTTLTTDGQATIAYADDDDELASINANDLDLDTDFPMVPSRLRKAFEAADAVDCECSPNAGTPDRTFFMRAVCALAGLQVGLDDIRLIPLLATPFP